MSRPPIEETADVDVLAVAELVTLALERCGGDAVRASAVATVVLADVADQADAPMGDVLGELIVTRHRIHLARCKLCAEEDRIMREGMT